MTSSKLGVPSVQGTTDRSKPEEVHMTVMTEAAPGAMQIRPFQTTISDTALDDLKQRIDATRWPSKELVNDRSQGVQRATMQALARYWTTEYDFGRLEAQLKALPQFIDRDRRARYPLHPRTLAA